MPATPRRNSKTDEPTRSSRRRTNQFLPPLCHSGGNQAYLPRPSLKTKSRRATAFRASGSRSSILAPNSIGNKYLPVTSRGAPRAGPKRHPSLGPNTAPFEAEKGHWNEAAYEGPYGTRQKLLRHLAFSGSQPEGLTQDWEKPPPHCASTLFPPSRIDPGRPTFQRGIGSPGRVFPSPHCEDADNRPVCGPSVFHLNVARDCRSDHR